MTPADTLRASVAGLIAQAHTILPHVPEALEWPVADLIDTLGDQLHALDRALAEQDEIDEAETNHNHPLWAVWRAQAAQDQHDANRGER